MDYATILDIPYVFSTNGDEFLFHSRAETDEAIETTIRLDAFPSPEQLWEVYKRYKGLETPVAEKIASQDYYLDASGRAPRYYQQIAINRTIEAIARGQNRILLIMATGTGKTLPLTRSCTAYGKQASKTDTISCRSQCVADPNQERRF